MHSRLASAAASASVRAPARRGFRSSAAPQLAAKNVKQLAKEVPLKGKSVLVRADLNVPIKGGVVKDKTRIVLSAPTIRFLLDQGAKVCIVCVDVHVHVCMRARFVCPSGLDHVGTGY